MERAGTPTKTFRDISWMPQGGYIEVWLGDVAAPVELCTSAFALAFDDEVRLLLANVLKRGPDIPGGHVEAKDADPEAAAVREAKEETGAAIRIVGKVGHLRLVVPEPPPGYRYGAESYQPFYAAVVESLGEVEMKEECGDPTFSDPMEAADNARFSLHRDLILAAAGMVRALAPSGPASRN